MTTIYTKEEVDKLIADLKIDILNSITSIMLDIKRLDGNLEAEHNENYGNFHDLKNRMDFNDAKAKEMKNNGVKSPYARE